MVPERFAPVWAGAACAGGAAVGAAAGAVVGAAAAGALVGLAAAGGWVGWAADAGAVVGGEPALDGPHAATRVVPMPNTTAWRNKRRRVTRRSADVSDMTMRRSFSSERTPATDLLHLVNKTLT